jgi:tetratricopeptide (TPR) repeat protein
MRTIKHGRWLRNLAAIVAAALLAGCGPPGARDLRQGERLIDSGRFADAVPPLRDAVQILSGASNPVQARALNLLGLAYAGARQLDAASQTYAQALKLDRNDAAIDYNLGCLRMAQGNLQGAIDDLTTYVKLRPTDVQGQLRLGEALFHYALGRSGQDRTRQLDSARREFQAAESIAATPDALNSLGLIELARRNAGAEAIRAAAADFLRAVQRDPLYGPALLNLAILQQQYLNQPRQALQNYRAYLALDPAPPRAKEVEKAAQLLDLNLRITITPEGGERPSAPPPQTRNYSPPTTAPVNTIQAPAESLLTSAPAPVPIPRSLPVPKRAPTPPAPTPSPPPSPPPKPVEFAQAPAVFVPPDSPAPQSFRGSSSPPDQVEEIEPAPPPSLTAAPRKTLVQKLNPLHWFSGNPKSADPSADEPSAEPAVPAGRRYQYLLPETFLPGDRTQAQRWAQQGVEERHQGNLTEATNGYQKAIDADPTYYDARLLLGLAAIDAHDYSTALRALDGALQLRPDSADARYAFAWTLQRRGYISDAARELEKSLAAQPDQVRAHLLLANLYAENLGETKLAREHYEQALALDPRNSQADAVRKWLAEHP